MDTDTTGETRGSILRVKIESLICLEKSIFGSGGRFGQNFVKGHIFVGSKFTFFTLKTQNFDNFVKTIASILPNWLQWDVEN